MVFSLQPSKLTCYLSALVIAFTFCGESAYAVPESPSLPPVEVLHWLTSSGESAAIKILKDKLQTEGITWKDVPIAGGGGDQAMTTLRARVISGNAPTAAQLIGFTAREWAEADLVGNISALAEKHKWAEVIPKPLVEFTTYEDKWFNVPLTIHTINSVWANKALLEKVNAKVPTTWDEFIMLLDTLQKSGVIPLAHGGQPWQDATLFDSVLLATGGLEFYKKSMIALDPKALKSDTMQAVFDRMLQLRSYMDPNLAGRDWNLATQMVINGQAAMQVMGDWAKSEFLQANKKPDTDFLCFRFPNTEKYVTFNADLFVLFPAKDLQENAQTAFALAVMDPEVQEKFSLRKGSIPARVDISPKNFDSCGQKAMEDVKRAMAAGTLVGDMAHQYANPPAVRQAMFDVISRHFNRQITSKEAVKQLADAVAAAQ
jgi:glucose/mannose transport system substrate-binding protein